MIQQSGNVGTAQHALPCPHCGRVMQLADTHLRVPYRRQHWWQFGDERSEYRCPGCSGFALVRVSPLGWGLYVALAAGLGTGWTMGVSRMALLVIGAIIAFVISGHAKRLVKV